MRQIKIWLLAVTLVGIWGCLPNTQLSVSPEDSATSTADGVIEEKATDVQASIPPKGFEVSTSNTVVENMVDGLGRPRVGPDRDQAVAALAQHGDEAVAEMERQLVVGDVDWQYRAVLVLKEVNTEKARTLMRRIALGEFGDGDAGWAARNLIVCDRTEASNLLTSTNREVLESALLAMQGQPINEELLALLKKCLAHRDYRTRFLAAQTLTAGTSGELAIEALYAIGEAMNTVADMPGIDDMSRQYHGLESTLGERYYQDYIGALAKAQVEDSVMHKLTNQLHGRAKDSAFLVLARRGDKSVREEVIRLIQDEHAGLFRSWATRALGDIGTHEDWSFLRTLAENAPLLRTMGGMGGGPTYPVRDAARSAIRAIEERELTNMSVGNLPEGIVKKTLTGNRELDNAIEQLCVAIAKAAGANRSITEEVRLHITNYQKAGGEDLCELLREMYDGWGWYYGPRVVIVQILREQGTSQAAAVLKGIALNPGENALALGRLAVEAFLEIESDIEQIIDLLDSDISNVYLPAWRALRGKELTEVTVRRLALYLDSDVSGDHTQVATTFSYDPSSATAALKVDLLLAAVPRLEYIKSSRELAREKSGEVAPPNGSTGRESSMGFYVQSLDRMKGAEPILLAKLSELKEGTLEHKIVVLALARQGNQSVYSAVRQIAQHDEEGVLRAQAVIGMGKIGSAQDIDWLRGLTESDPFALLFENYGGNGWRWGEPIYMVRRSAENAIRMIEAREGR